MIFFFFNDTATTEIYTLSLHDALPIFRRVGDRAAGGGQRGRRQGVGGRQHPARGRRLPHPADARGARRAAGALARHARDRKSTRLNSSHANISYAVFCLKKKTRT